MARIVAKEGCWDAIRETLLDDSFGCTRLRLRGGVRNNGAHVTRIASMFESLEPGVDRARREETPSVLVVDDIRANLIALDGLLKSLNCNIVLASSGNEALRQLLKRAFAVILLDVQMPEMDGYEVALHVRKNPSTANVPIIFVTAALHAPENIHRGYGSGAVDFLFKPIDPFILRSKVQVFLDLYAVREQVTVALDRAEEAFRELQAAQAQLVQSEKMASLGQLVAGIAHEINNPLAFVVSHVETVKRCFREIEKETGNGRLRESGGPWQRARVRLDEMSNGLERIRDLVLKLRTFSRLDEGERNEARISECVDSVLTILGHRLDGRIRVETRFEGPDVIECYPRLLNQALMNLVSNAIEAIEDRGTITISAGAIRDNYVITVQDTGMGVPESLRDRLFEPFFTTKPVGKGTGLGLSIAYAIVRKHGGTLEIESPEAGGTRMKVAIPLEPDRGG